MSKNFELSLVMRLRDLASSGFARSQRDIQSGIAKTEKSTENLTRTVSNLGATRAAAGAAGDSAEQSAQSGIAKTKKATDNLTSTVSKLGNARTAAGAISNGVEQSARSGIGKTEKATESLTRTVGNLGKARAAAEVLGIRTEQNIQREIQRTEAAYDRLKRSGTLSMSEQARAANVARNRIRELNNEMGKFTLAQRAANGLRTGASVAAGVMAGGYVLSKPINQTMDYGMRLAQMSNTAFNDRDTAGRIAGKSELNDAVVKSVRHGGGTRDGAATALDTLIASGTMNPKDAMGMLPSLMKASTASGADAGELAQIGIRSMQTMKIKPADMGRVFDMAISAGQQGGFELKDMAKWLPQQMAVAQNSGISGIGGLAKLLAANQASAITAGTKDGAGNNLVNLLGKINSRDTSKDAQRLGVNLSGTLAKARGKGIDSLDAFVGVVDHIVGKDKNYQALQAKLKTATGADRKAMLDSQVNILQGSGIGEIVQDREALLALVGIMGNRDYMSGVQKNVMAEANAKPGEGATDKNFAVIANEAGFKTQQMLNEKIFATQNAFEKITPLVGAVADGFSAVAQQYPLLTAATVGTTAALTALAATAGAMSLANILGGKGGGLTGLLSSGKGLVAGAVMRARAMTLPGLALTGAVEGGSAAFNAYQGKDASNMLSNMTQGTVVADLLGEAIARSMAAFGNQNAKEAMQINLHIDGEQIAAVVNKRNARTASRN